MKDVMIKLRLNYDTKEMLKHFLEKDGESISGFLRKHIEEYLKKKNEKR